MTKFDALRRFLLPCFAPTSPVAAAAPSSSSSASAAHPKKRLSTSLRDDTPDDGDAHDQGHPTAAPRRKSQEGGGGGRKRRSSSSSKRPPSSPSDDSGSSRSFAAAAHHQAPPRASKSMVIGTIYGRRRGHVWFCVQNDRRSTRPALLLELSMPIALLVKEMRCGLVRLALECDRSDLCSVPLRSVPVWSVLCNGRKVGFAARRRPTAQCRLLLKTMQSISVGAGVIPAGFSSAEADGAVATNAGDEVMYMRANYDCVVGSADSEAFHLINPDECPGQELSVFLLRTR